MKIKRISVSLLVFALILGGLGFFYFNKPLSPTEDSTNPAESSSLKESGGKDMSRIVATSGYGEKRKEAKAKEAVLKAFIEKEMTGEFGIYTNYLDTNEKQEVATGHEVLSESSGLLLRYSALSEDSSLFDSTWQTALATFNDKNQFSYRYSPKRDKLFPVNAVVDDLRLVRGLLEGAAFLDDAHLSSLAKKYGERISETNITGNQLVDFHDSQTNQRNKFITLCYIDLRTLNLLPLATAEKQKLLSKQEQILAKGYLTDDFPLYQTRYDYQKQRYFDSKEINIVESLLTVLHLSEAGLEKPESIAFIKQQVADKSLVNRYTKAGKILDDNQSPASYAIAAMIASEVGDQEFYNQAMEQMEASQIHDENSPLNGGYGDPAAKAAFSFNNLMALLAYQY